MFRLEESWAFYLLLILPALVLLGYWANQKQKNAIKSFGDAALFDRLLNDKQRGNIRFYLFLGAIFFLILALVNPQFGLKKEKVKVEKSDIVIALDISNSMNATDVSPSRLEKAKRFISQLINARKGDQIGLIFFAGGAYLQMPLTSDYAAADLFTKAANTEMAGTQGTAIGEAIQLAMKSVKEDNQRALIILSDGEDHDENALSKAKDAASKGWSIFSIGVGTDEGGFVPVIQEGREEFKTDEEGNPVKSLLNKDLLQSIATDGNGAFYMLTDGENNIINDINTQIEKLQKRAVEVKSFTEYRSFYQYFLFAAILLILFSFFYPIHKKVSI
jgi:Ca-activated chloride channel family protein